MKTEILNARSSGQSARSLDSLPFVLSLATEPEREEIYCHRHEVYARELGQHAATPGGSLRDVQQLAGHRSIEQTQAYIDGSARAKRRLIELI